MYVACDIALSTRRTVLCRLRIKI